jgi:DNA phosphorothioation-associated putative methyltransferase
MDEPPSQIERHKTAIRRKDFSLSVKCLLRDELVVPGRTFFDYGCGHGEDVELLGTQGVAAKGWDPAFRPDELRTPAEIVNLGYVLNVIEDPGERAAVLGEAWRLATRMLVVAARVNIEGRGYSRLEFGDGIVTGMGTFQKYYSQAELKEYLESRLGVEAIPATLGVYYLFKDETLQQQILAKRYQRAPAKPKKTFSELKFDENRELLEPFLSRVLELGRLPEADEYEGYQAVVAKFGSAGRALALLKRVTRLPGWAEIRQQRTDDLLVYLALARFRKRPPVSKLPATLRRDIKEFFGSYKRACERADALLLRAGDAMAIDEACCRSTLGKLLPNALYVHRCALDRLEPILRVYEGCARAYLGEMEGANIIKLHRFSGKVSYLFYPTFDTEAHPVLLRSLKLSLRTLQLDCYDYTTTANPPVLHRKEAFLPEGYPGYQVFAALTRQEDEAGLLANSVSIGTRDGWESRLREARVRIDAHQLVRA